MLLVALGASTASAAPPGPAWEVISLARPTNFSVADTAPCLATGGVGQVCDQYLLTLTNIGSGPTTGPVTIRDVLPSGLKALEVVGQDLENVFGGLEKGFGWDCSKLTTTCTYSEPVPPGDTLVVTVELEVATATGTITNAATVSGGGAPSASTSPPLTLPNTVDATPAGFGIAGIGFAAHDASGRLDTQAGDHPDGLTTSLLFNNDIASDVQGGLQREPVRPAKDVAYYLPLGFLGDATAAAHCTELQLLAQGSEVSTECPVASRVGTAVLISGITPAGTVVPYPPSDTSAIYNMVPDSGYPAQLGFKYLSQQGTVYTSVVHTPSGYALRVAAPGIPRAINLVGFQLNLFGDPNTADGNPSGAKAFFTNPGDCQSGPLNARAEVDSWGAPGVWYTAEAPAYPKIEGCNLLQFEPTVELTPEVTQAEAPTGLQVKIKVPQSPSQFPVLATPDLKNVAMTLPEGMTISPGGANGLAGCPATGPGGFDMPTNLPGGVWRTPDQAGQGEAIGPDGMTHLTAGHCPSASQIGTVKISTRVLESPLKGHVYVAEPPCGGAGQPACTAADAADGRLFGLFVEAEGSGVVVKLKGSVSADPATGRLTARFDEDPQLPVSEVTLNIEGGSSAPLANPRQCGLAQGSADLTPWSAPVTPDALVPVSFGVDWDGAGTPCPGTLPFAPALAAGVTNAGAARFSTFSFTLTRGDRQQDLRRLQVKLPVGMLGTLASVPLCAEPAAAQGTCGEASRIGATLVRAGSGSQPLGVTGRVYLTGPYDGAPFGLSIVVPAVAGPFNLGDVVVRSRIDVDPDTSAVTVTSDPLPQFKDGVPLRLQMVNVSIDRPGFFFNPTNCAVKQISSTVESEQGAAVALTAPVAAEGCNNLAFHPGFSVSTHAKTSKAQGASLSVKVTSTAGQANIAKVNLQLPKQLPARLTTLQKACTEAQFAANPAGCPAASVIGSAKAITPVLNVPLIGPADLVSHGGAAFPDVEFILQGQGVRIDLDGKTQIKKGITYSRFETVPDAPISSFETVLPQGPHSVLATNLPLKARGSLCGTKLVIPT
ncbi:MAG TPA: hypothetical protein VGH60_07010, partial [Solirubrobacteraceae bacterium]